MKTTHAKTYSGNIISVNKKAYRKAVKALLLKASKPYNISNPSNEEVIKYMRCKQSSFNHAIDRANLYAMRIIERNVFVI